MYMMPQEILQVLYETSRTGIPHHLSEHQNQLMAEYTRSLMQVINSMEIDAMECYHSTIWDGSPLVDIMKESPSVEFWSAHAPYGSWVDPSSPDESIRKRAVEAYCESVDMAAKLGAHTVVAHPGAHADYDVPKQARIEHSAESLQLVADHAAQYGIQIAIEPLPKDEPGNSLDEVLWMIEQIDRPNVGVNFDVNHLFPASAIPDLIRKAGKRILSVHISDQDDQERHWLPFAGKLDWSAVLTALSRAGYTGPLIYEAHIKGAKSCEEVGRKIVDNYSHLIKLAP